MFFTYSQNNSGGKFTINNKVGPYVIIEASTASKANKIAESIGIYFDGVADDLDCECCGDRWYPAYDTGNNEPMICGTKAEDYNIGYDHKDDRMIYIYRARKKTPEILPQKK